MQKENDNPQSPDTDVPLPIGHPPYFLAQIAIVILLLFECGCVSGSGRHKSSTTSANIAEVLQLINGCPEWTEIEQGDTQKPRQIMRMLKGLSRFDTKTLRGAISQKIETNYQFEDFAKLYLINRFIFAVPEWVEATNYVTFAGWFGIPKEEGKIDLLYPFEQTSDGGLKLVGRHIGYLGPPYPALMEFDYLSKKYGRRPPTETANSE